MPPKRPDTTRPVLVHLPTDLVEWIDEVRGDVPRNRWVQRLCERERNGASVSKSSSRYVEITDTASGYAGRVMPVVESRTDGVLVEFDDESRMFFGIGEYVDAKEPVRSPDVKSVSKNSKPRTSKRPSVAETWRR